MTHTFSHKILAELTTAGFTVAKCHHQQEWQILSNKEVLMRSRWLGELTKKASVEFNLK